MTIKQVREWLATLPPEFDNAEMQSTVGDLNYNAKRMIAFRYKDCGQVDVVVNSMGTHLSDEFFKNVEIVSTIHCDGMIHKG